MGSPFNYYTYTGIERSVQFNFKVYSLNSQEHMIAWNKLDFLTSLAYPQGYQTVGIIAPIMKLTLGNMYVGKTGFIESLTYTIDDNAPWEIGVTPDGKMDSELKNYKLPRVVDVSVTVKFIENKSTTNTAGTAVTLYGIKPYKKVALQSGGEPKNPSTDLAKGDGSSTTIGGAQILIGAGGKHGNGCVYIRSAFTEIQGSTAINITSPATLIQSDDVTITGNTIINGDLIVGKNLVVTGKITAGSDVQAGGVSLRFHTHLTAGIISSIPIPNLLQLIPEGTSDIVDAVT
jgi:hypothetical protein